MSNQRQISIFAAFIYSYILHFFTSIAEKMHGTVNLETKIFSKHGHCRCQVFLQKRREAIRLRTIFFIVIFCPYQGFVWPSSRLIDDRTLEANCSALKPRLVNLIIGCLKFQIVLCRVQ